MKIVNVSQRENDWLEWRRQGVTATDAAILLGRSPYKTRWRLWAEKTGFARPVDLSMNPMVRHGVENEDRARQAHEQKHGDMLLPACVESDQEPLIKASLDGLNNANEPVELKCPAESTWNDVCANGAKSKAYNLYYPQVQHQMLATGAQWSWLVFYREGEIREFRIERHEPMVQEILAEARVFWQQVVNKKEPEKDPERDLYIPRGDAAEQWINAAEAYRLQDSEIQELKQRLKELKASQEPHLDTMKSLMGEYFHADYCGVMVTRYKTAGRVNYTQLLADKASSVKPEDIEQYRSEASERCRVTVTDSVKPRHIVDEDVLAPLDDVPEEVDSFYW